MKRSIVSFFESSRPKALFVISFCFFLFCLLCGGDMIVNIAAALLLITLATLIVSIGFQFYTKNWSGAIIGLSLVSVMVAIFIFFSFEFFMIAQSKPDEFAADLKIPDNIIAYQPIAELDEQKLDSMRNLKQTRPDLILYNSSQPGLYEFDLWVGQIESGTIYLKAFEITKNYPLSTDRLKSGTFISVYNDSDSLVKYSKRQHFTIIEGDWGMPYAARFEVWLQPDDKTPEKKIFQKNYIIEGWQR